MFTRLRATHKGKRLKVPVELRTVNGRIEFHNSHSALTGEIKAMQGSQWHGYDESPRKLWSVKDCPRNQFQLDYLKGENPYAWWEQPLVRHEYRHPLMQHQKDMADAALTYHYQVWAAEMSTGKTLAAQSVIETAEVWNWLWVGPKSSLDNIRREFNKWDFQWNRHVVKFISYEQLVKLVDNSRPGHLVTHGLICDESSKLKNYTANRTKAVQWYADEIRTVHGDKGYVILMSGTPSPKSPVDWWAQCEIVAPGFLREGSPKALEQRLAFLRKRDLGGMQFNERIGWRDDESKCDVCGVLKDDHGDDHHWHPSINEVAYLEKRLKGLVTIVHNDCLNLPDKHYRTVTCEPSASVLRAAKVIVDSAPNTITGLTWLRELSDGFQYRDEQQGFTKCDVCQGTGTTDEWFDPDDQERTFESTDFLDQDLVDRLEQRPTECTRCTGTGQMPRMVRTALHVACPKDKVLKDLLDENDDVGRIVIFAGFQGSVDRISNICRAQHWDVCQVDGRGQIVTDHEGNRWAHAAVLDHWANPERPRVAWVAHPESGGMSFTLVEARMAVFYSNTFKPEYRTQAEDRIHRLGMDMNVGATIVDILHLPSDERVLQVVRENRRLEKMTMGDFGYETDV